MADVLSSVRGAAFTAAPHDSAARQRIEARGLSKAFSLGGSELLAVDRVSFTIREGEFVALLGPSGCGKSTILNMIAGLLPISGGEVLLDGERVAHGRTRRQVGYVFQRDTVFPWRTVARNIGYGLELAGMAREVREARVHEVIRQAGLQGFENAFPLMLSGGMRQRVALMRTLIMQPEILLMDEPFGALDTHTKLEMHKILLEIWERERQTVLFVTHDLSEALTLSDRIILLSARPGRLKEDFAVPFPRPRDAITLRETREYGELFAKVWHSLGAEFAKTRAE
jgi:NitT/TauT family transport system ATP-binding protein